MRPAIHINVKYCGDASACGLHRDSIGVPHQLTRTSGCVETVLKFFAEFPPAGGSLLVVVVLVWCGAAFGFVGVVLFFQQRQ